MSLEHVGTRQNDDKPCDSVGYHRVTSYPMLPYVTLCYPMLPYAQSQRQDRFRALCACGAQDGWEFQGTLYWRTRQGQVWKEAEFYGLCLPSDYPWIHVPRRWLYQRWWNWRRIFDLPIHANSSIISCCLKRVKPLNVFIRLLHDHCLKESMRNLLTYAYADLIILIIQNPWFVTHILFFWSVSSCLCPFVLTLGRPTWRITSRYGRYGYCPFT